MDQNRWWRIAARMLQGGGLLLALLSGVFSAVDVWGSIIPGCLIGVGIMAVGIWIHYQYYERNRQDCLRGILAREPSLLEEQYAIIMQKGSIGREDVERLWLGLTAFYKVPPAQLRASDGLMTDLKGLMGHIDYDPFFCSMVLLHRGPAKQALRHVVDWADLILCLHQFEIERGKLGTKRMERNGRAEYLWNG